MFCTGVGHLFDSYYIVELQIKFFDQGGRGYSYSYFLFILSSSMGTIILAALSYPEKTEYE